MQTITILTKQIRFLNVARFGENFSWEIFLLNQNNVKLAATKQRRLVMIFTNAHLIITHYIAIWCIVALYIYIGSVLFLLTQQVDQVYCSL